MSFHNQFSLPFFFFFLFPSYILPLLHFVLCTSSTPENECVIFRIDLQYISPNSFSLVVLFFPHNILALFYCFSHSLYFPDIMNVTTHQKKRHNVHMQIQCENCLHVHALYCEIYCAKSEQTSPNKHVNKYMSHRHTKTIILRKVT